VEGAGSANDDGDDLDVRFLRCRRFVVLVGAVRRFRRCVQRLFVCCRMLNICIIESEFVFVRGM
jgi:hypothetical protein